MKPQAKEFIYFFLLPGVVVGMTFTILNQILPTKFNIWIGLLVTLTFSIVVKAWTEIVATRSALANLQKELIGRASILNDYDELMKTAEDLVLKPNSDKAIILVYKGYSASMEREGDYFQATVDAIEQGKIGEYHRIMSIRNGDEAQSFIDVLKVLSKSEKASSKCKFYANFRPASNYISFIVFDDDECVIGLPNLAAAPEQIIGHRCGLYVKDPKVVNSLKEVFTQIKFEKTTEIVHMPSSHATEDVWKKLKTDLVEKANHYSEHPTQA